LVRCIALTQSGLLMKPTVVVWLISLTFVAHRAAAQEIVNVRAFQQGQTIGVSYDLLATDNTAFLIKLLVSQDGGATYIPVHNDLSGDVNKLVSRGIGKLIIWDYQKQQDVKGDNLLFKILAKPLDSDKNDGTRKIEDKSLVVKLRSVSRLKNDIVLTLTYYNKTLNLISTFHGNFVAEGDDGRTYSKVGQDISKLIELKSRAEVDVVIVIEEVNPEVGKFRNVRFNFGTTGILFTDVVFDNWYVD
jgi:hypothetical protein